jgi:hypothetical protein
MTCPTRKPSLRFCHLAGLSAIVLFASTAHAVDCPTAQQLNGSSGFGQSIAMMNDQVTGEYVVVSSATSTVYFQKPVGSTATFGSPTLVDNVAGTVRVVPCAIVVGGGGVVNVYRQARDSTGACAGPPFVHEATLRPSSGDPTGTFGQSLSYDENANLLVACSSQYCWFFSKEGNAGWVQLSMGGPIGGYAASLDGLGYLTALQNTSTLGIYTYTWTTSSVSWSPFQQISAPAGRTFGGMSGWWDRAYLGVTGGSSPGVVNTYSNNSLSVGSGGPWTSWANLQLSTAGASPNFGAAVASSGDSLLVTDPAGPSGPTVYQYQIMHQQPGVTDMTTDWVTQIGAGSPTFGSAIAVDAQCAAVGSPSTNTVELFPVPNPLPTLCCNGTGSCTSTGSGCSSPNAITLSIPSVGGSSSASLTVDPSCTDYQTALINFSSQTCAAVNFSGELLGPATVCFPLVSGSSQQFISRCDPLATLCTGTGTTVQHNGQGAAFCCTPLGGNPSGSEFCATTSSFSSFAYSGSWKDSDGDGTPDIADNCPLVSNPNQHDQDGDLIGDACDNCPGVPNQDQKRTTTAPVGDACNCALQGVRFGPTGTPCSQPVPALPRSEFLVLSALLASLGTIGTRKARRVPASDR